MIRGSKVAREINLEKKRVLVPTLMDEEPFFTLPIVVVAALTVEATTMPTSVVSSLMATMNEPKEPII
jgi:hypothetical protein